MLLQPVSGALRHSVSEPAVILNVSVAQPVAAFTVLSHAPRLFGPSARICWSGAHEDVACMLLTVACSVVLNSCSMAPLSALSSICIWCWDDVLRACSDD